MQMQKTDLKFVLKKRSGRIKIMSNMQKIARVLKKATAPMRKKYQTKNVKRLMTSNKAYKKGGKV
jgi:hypothetical protein